MEINYWDCPNAEPEEYGEGENCVTSYGCAHPNSQEGFCTLDNRGGEKADCPLLKEVE